MQLRSKDSSTHKQEAFRWVKALQIFNLYASDIFCQGIGCRASQDKHLLFECLSVANCLTEDRGAKERTLLLKCPSNMLGARASSNWRMPWGLQAKTSSRGRGLRLLFSCNNYDIWWFWLRCRHLYRGYNSKICLNIGCGRSPILVYLFEASQFSLWRLPRL